MLSKMEIAAVVAKALNKDTSDVLTEIYNGNALALYDHLQDIYSSFAPFKNDAEREKAWKVMRPVAKAIDALWDITKDEILASDGITCVETDNTRIPMKTLRFWYENQPFCVDILLDTDEEVYEAWLYADGYGIKEFMFGSPVNSQRFGQPETTTLDSFTRTVMGNLYDYLPDYIEEHVC